jgi:hypothetical protein
VISTAISDHLVTHTATNETGFDEVTESMEAWYCHPKFDPDLPVLWDLRGAKLQRPDSDMSGWSDHNRSLVNRLRAGRKTAWVFSDARAAEYTVNFLAAAEWQHRVRIFNDDIEAARAWLKSTIR